jgi:hypothetical protein
MTDTCDGCRALRQQVAELASLVAEHLSAAEANADYIAIGPEPSDEARAIARAIREDDGA